MIRRVRPRWLLAPYWEDAHPDHTAATQPDVAGEAVVDLMTARLGLQHEGEARVFVDDDGRHGIHHEHETHEVSGSIRAALEARCDR